MAKKKKVAKKAKSKSKVAKKILKKTKKRVVAKKAGTKTKAAKTVAGSMVKVGEVTHYFPHVNAAAVKVLKNSINVGDEIYLKGHTTDFKEKIESIQLDRSPIREGKKGQEIGLLVSSRVRIGDSVYKV